MSQVYGKCNKCGKNLTNGHVCDSLSAVIKHKMHNIDAENIKNMLRNHALSDQSCIRCNSKKHSVDDCQHEGKKIYTQADMDKAIEQAKRETLDEIEKEYNHEYMGQNQGKLYREIINNMRKE